jgi:perosamine synthetase
MTGRMPIALPDLSGNEENYVGDAIRSSWISSTGRYLARFEEQFAELCGTRHAIAVSNGTVALHLALVALDVGPGDEVIVPSLTYIASVNVIRYVGATPVFVDVEPQSWCLDLHAVEVAITSRTRAVIAVHLYGQPADMDGLRAVCAPQGIRIVEDAAEAPLASYRGRPTGGLGEVGAFSFFGNKLFTSGEGGAVTVDDDDLSARMRLLRDQGMDPSRRYHFPVVGFNFRLTNVAAALLCAQLERREEFLDARHRIYRRYEARLAHVPGLTLQADIPGTERCPWLFSALVDPTGFGRDRDALMARLEAEGIETRPFFPPIHRQPPYEAEARAQGAHLPVSDRLSAQGLNLPTFVAMTEADVDRVCDAVLAFAGPSL